MPTPPPRKRFQIHLSTAIVLMFVAGGLIWANIVKRETGSMGGAIPNEEVTRQMSEADFFTRTSEEEWYGNFTWEYGWPAQLMECSSEAWSSNAAHNKFRMLYGPKKESWKIDGIICNALVAIVLLCFAYFLCEWLIRRRAARKGA